MNNIDVRYSKTGRYPITMPFLEPLGHIDIPQLIRDSNGIIRAEIFDSGVYRVGVGTYQITDHSPSQVRIERVDSSSDNELIINKRIPITFQTCVFIGLYIGDGAKAASSGGTGTISFSQTEPNLTNFVRSQFIRMFGPTLSFTHRVNEDALYFMTQEARQDLVELRNTMRSEGTEIPSEDDLQRLIQRDLATVGEQQRASTRRALENYRQKANLWNNYRDYLVEFLSLRRYMNEYLERQKVQELASSGFPLGTNDQIAVNIRLPGVKGARQAGKSSRSDELDVNGMAPFRPLLLRILADIEKSILANQNTLSPSGSTTPWITWLGPPHEYCKFILDNHSYITRSPSILYITPTGQVRRMTIRSVTDAEIIAAKPSSSHTFGVPRYLQFTPLLGLFFGLYLAEGNTSKDKIFKFSVEHSSGLALGFTGSEHATIEICVRAMAKIFTDDQGEITTWRIKVGTKYFSEVAALGHKIGSVALRRGPKGQGAAGSLEVVEIIKKWSLKVIPILQQNEESFDHLEFTGAGIPRVDIFYRNSAAPYLFGLMRDTIVNPAGLSDYSYNEE